MSAAQRAPRLRFAPTPSGHLTVSAARVAVANALFAARHGGSVLLRLDDLDPARSKPAFAEAIVQDLAWLGLRFAETIHQSDRATIYAEAIARLQAAGRLYPCFESPEELRFKQEQRQKRGQPTVYDRAMLKLTPAQRATAESKGKRPYWRFLLSDRELRWDDAVVGPLAAKLPAISDPVVVTADGAVLPLFAAVVDDAACRITHVIRGPQAATETGIQLDLFDALGAPRPALAHLPPLADDRPTPMGRKAGTLTVRSLRADGVSPLALAACLAGSPDASVAAATAAGSMTAGGAGAEPAWLPALAAGFTLPRGAAARPLDSARLLRLNRALLAEAPFAEVADRLPAGATEAFWLALRGEVDLLSEARGWWDVVAGTIVPPVIEGAQSLLQAALATLPPEPWDRLVFATWLAALETATGRDADALVPLLRLALTGEETGPDLGALLPLMGRARAALRLQVAAS